MKFLPIDPPREIKVGLGVKFIIKDCGRMDLSHDEQITFTTSDGSEFDVCRKDFGFYATPSLNERLPQHGLRPVLIKNRLDKYFVLLVEKGKDNLFDKYIRNEEMKVVVWMDETEALQAVFKESKDNDE